MAPTDSTSPLRHPKHLGNKRILYILIPLLLINAGIAKILINQIDIKASAQADAFVKDESVTASSLGSIEANHIAQAEITPAPDQPVITTYIVKSGDTLSGIASQFGISTNTIRWANDLTPKSPIKVGDELIILPVTGITYTVKKGDTLSGIAIKFDASQAEILYYNDIEEKALKVGMEIIIPEAEPLPVAPAKKVAVKETPKTLQKESSSPKVTKEATPKKDEDDTDVKTDVKTKFTNPVPGALLTQRIHDGNAVDFGLAVGTPVLAAAGGKVIIAKDSGYNGGYGDMIVITHNDGSQTLYAHLSKVDVSVGDTVSQGEVIGLSGNSGKSTGPHLHYKEISTGTKNTFASLPLH